MKKTFLVIGLALLGFALAQGTTSLIVAGKKSTLPWINFKGKVYIPLESLQKAGMVIKKIGNTYELSFPKPPLVTTAVTTAPTTTAILPVVVPPVQTIVPTVPITPTTNPSQVISASSLNTIPSGLANLRDVLSQIQEPAFVKTNILDPIVPTVATIDPKSLPLASAMSESPSVATPTTAPVASEPTPTARSITVSVPSTTPVSPASTVGTVITRTSVNANTTTKPLLEGCSEQILNNGVWSAKLVAATNITVENRVGYAFIVEMTNLTRDTLSLFDSGFSDGEGGLSNYILVTADNRIYSARDTNLDFVYQSVGANQKMIFTLKFTFDSRPTSPPARLFLTQERPIQGFPVPNPSLRFQLSCK